MKENKEVIVTVGTLETLCRSTDSERKTLVKNLADEAGYLEYSNFETWHTAKFLNYCKNLRETFVKRGEYLVQEYDKREKFDPIPPKENAIYRLADEIKDHFESKAKQYENIDWNSKSLMLCSYTQVHWEELAKVLLFGE